MTVRGFPANWAPTRRELLRTGLAAGLVAPLAVACSGGEERPDQLQALAASARRDARDATELAKSTPGLSKQLQLVASVRGKHAEALQAEIDRERPPDPDEPKPPAVASGRAADVAALGQALGTAERVATRLVPTVPAYRAGLLGAVAAACLGLRQLSEQFGAEQQDEPETESVRPAGQRELPEEAVEAVQQALGTEHAAIWVYGLVSAFLPASYAEGLDKAAGEHRSRRDATQRMLTAAGTAPRPAEPAYVPPHPVRDEDSAVRLVITAESDAEVAWRGVLERTDDRELRGLALRALISSATRASRWRAEAGQTPSVRALPGTPA